MLYEIKGTRLPNPPWHKFAVDEVLDYYNGPRLLLQRCDAGQWYLAWWSDSDAELDRWIYLPLSVDRMVAVLSGQVECLNALRRPEGGQLLVVDIHVATDAVAQTVITDANAIPEDARPLPGARLNIGLPPAVAAEWADAVAAPGKVVVFIADPQPSESLAVGNVGTDRPSDGKAEESTLETFDRILQN